MNSREQKNLQRRPLGNRWRRPYVQSNSLPTHRVLVDIPDTNPAKRTYNQRFLRIEIDFNKSTLPKKELVSKILMYERIFSEDGFIPTITSEIVIDLFLNVPEFREVLLKYNFIFRNNRLFILTVDSAKLLKDDFEANVESPKHVYSFNEQYCLQYKREKIIPKFNNGLRSNNLNQHCFRIILKLPTLTTDFDYVQQSDINAFFVSANTFPALSFGGGGGGNLYNGNGGSGGSDDDDNDNNDDGYTEPPKFNEVFKNFMDNGVEGVFEPITIQKLSARTHIPISTIKSMRNNPKYKNKQNIIACCLAMGIPITYSYYLLYRSGIILNDSLEDRVYFFLLQFQHKTLGQSRYKNPLLTAVDEANKLLEKLGLNRLT